MKSAIVGFVIGLFLGAATLSTASSPTMGLGRCVGGVCLPSRVVQRLAPVVVPSSPVVTTTTTEATTVEKTSAPVFRSPLETDDIPLVVGGRDYDGALIVSVGASAVAYGVPSTVVAYRSGPTFYRSGPIAYRSGPVTYLGESMAVRRGPIRRFCRWVFCR